MAEVDLVSLARKLRPLIVKAAASLDDKDISEAASLCDCLHGDGRAIEAGTRINWHGVVKRAALTLWDRPDNWPDQNPNGWEDLAYRGGIRIIPETITTGLAFRTGEQGWWKDELYESILPTPNTWNPDQYPEGWKKVMQA